ncbi:glycosyltransferase family 2 protein [Bradyrhizobium australiense]|uniref:Glycosyltransferase n=1 Tax=Bradyrhizobium australiense TaxID=2721161 RepID=A0A7Y4GXD8_9BRAD|nr:glycosyltransferase family 2 protein [Bradyrhizobium australiense]NOJ43705.1 glycosyltransferase [Bradyrhizobium australiense]
MKDCSASARPLVAVVTPVYNGGTYLEATMRCVQQQTYDKLIHVIVDNCSSDSTPEIIDRYRSQRVELLTIRNDRLLPLRENWTKAFCAVPAEASYVKILCADDLMRRDCIARFVEIAQSDEKIEVVLCDDVFIDKVHRANLPLNQTVFDGTEAARKILDESINWLPYHHLFVRYHGGAQSAEFFNDAPVHFDFAAVVRRSLRGKFAYLHDPLVYTRWHANSLTSQQLGADQLEGILERFDIICAFGGQCWDESAFRLQKERMRARLMRLAIKWAVKGRPDAARGVLRGLKERQVGPNAADWSRSIIGWIPYERWKRSWRLPTGPEIDEAKFCSESFLKQGPEKACPAPV